MNDQSDLLAELVRARFPRQLAHPMLASHQQTALTRVVEMMRRRRGGILADEAGMGKSFVAAAAAAHFRTEGMSVEVIVPASLRAQWDGVLRRFDLEGLPIVSHESLHRRPSELSLHRSKLIIVDEAHRFRNPQTKRYRALCDRAIGQAVLLVTATPVCNRLDDLFALLRVFAADDILRQEGILSLAGLLEDPAPDALQRLIEELVIRRTRESLPEALAFAGVDRKVIPFEIEEGEEIGARIDELQFPLIVRPADRHLLRMLLRRRLESSQAALRDSLGRQRRFYRRALEAGLDGCRLSKREFLRVFGDGGEEEPFQELMFRTFWFQPGDISAGDIVDVETELKEITTILSIVGDSENGKLKTLVDLCEALRESRVLIFTSATATAKVIYDGLCAGRRAGLVSSERARIGADACPDSAYVLHLFAAGRLDLLVATDLASEGLNLHSANVVIHYDLPWNPVKLDQRNGRAARIGQTSSCVRAYYFVPSSRSDRRHSLRPISRKARIIRGLFGRGSGGPFPPSIRGQAWLESSMLLAGERAGRPTALRNGGRSPLLLIREITGSEVVDRIAVVDGDQLRFGWERIEAGCLPGANANPIVDVAQAVDEHRIRLENRLVIPGRIPRHDRSILRRRLEVLGAWGNRWGELLSVPYCHGIERALHAVTEAELTREAAAKLAEMLVANTRIRPSFVRIQRVAEGAPFAPAGARTS